MLYWFTFYFRTGTTVKLLGRDESDAMTCAILCGTCKPYDVSNISWVDKGDTTRRWIYIDGSWYDQKTGEVR